MQIPIFSLYQSVFLRFQLSDVDYGVVISSLFSSSMKAFVAVNFPLITPLPEMYTIL